MTQRVLWYWQTSRPRGVLLVAIAAAAALSACRGKEGQSVPAAADASPVNSSDPPPAQEKALVAQAVALRSGLEPPEPTLRLNGRESATPEVLAAYNQQLARLIFRQRDAPETLEELVRKWPMPRLPTPPAGQQIVYDARNRIIRLEAQ